LKTEVIEMTLPSNTRLGPYEIRSRLGEGGMGEVYRARDTKLGRDVAIKVLPASLSENADRLNRFMRKELSIATSNLTTGDVWRQERISVVEFAV
jgi:eukaryotic-like serine/threonine-protein kinase